MKHSETEIQQLQQQQPGTGQPLTLATRLAALVTIAVSLFLLVRTISEYDIWFHLTLGREILHTGSLPVIDTFSLMNRGRVFHDSQWLFQVLAAAGYQYWGAYWLQLLQVGLWGIAFRAVYQSVRIWGSALKSWLLLLVVVVACEERFSIRPELISVAVLTLLYWRLQSGRFRSVADMAFLVMLQIIWTNSHGIFVIGPFMAGCYALEAVVRDVGQRKFSESRPLILLTVLLALSCLITPYGWDGLKFAWLLATQVGPSAPAIFNSVYDLRPPFGSSSRLVIAFWFYFALVVACFSSLIAVALHDRRKIPIARFLILVAMFVLSLTGIRNIPLFAVVAAPFIAEAFSLIDSQRSRGIISACVATSLLAGALVWSPRPALNHLVTWVPYRFGLGLSSDYMPLGLPGFLERIHFSGAIYNSQNLGGFYEFHGYPRRIPLLDGRFEAYNPQELNSLYETAFNAVSHPESWYALEKRFDFQGLLLENGSADSLGLLPLIAKESKWTLVYLDNAASFWLRSDRIGLPPEFGEADISRLVEHVGNVAQVDNLDIFLDKTLRYPAQRIHLLELAEKRWKMVHHTRNLGLLQMNLGKLEAAEATFKRLLARYPDSLLTLTTLSQIALLRGDRVGAEDYLLQGLARFPDDTDLRDNLAAVRQAGNLRPNR